MAHRPTLMEVVAVAVNIELWDKRRLAVEFRVDIPQTDPPGKGMVLIAPVRSRDYECRSMDPHRQ